MTHDELLTDIDTKILLSERVIYPIYMQALRAVVELHKPSLIPDWVPTDKELMCWCAHAYPCPTIQAIEKELQ